MSSIRQYGVSNSASDAHFRTRTTVVVLNGALTTTPIVFDLRNWAGHYVTLHCSQTDGYVKFSDMEIDVVDETAQLLVAPDASLNEPTECCFKVVEGGTLDVFVHPKFPWLHAVRAYPLDGYLRIAK